MGRIFLVNNLSLDIDWFLQLCDQVLYHENTVDTGLTKQLNLQYRDDTLGLQPQYYYHTGWYLDLCGIEFCYEIIDSSYTIGHVNDTQYVMSGSGWSVHFKMINNSGQRTLSFQGRWVFPHIEYFSGSVECFERDRLLIKLALDMNSSKQRTTVAWPGNAQLGLWSVEIR